jgi:thiosulfate/3-mercaptopyruvate sulfurtransferase
VSVPEGVLVSTDWLEEHLGADDLCIVDIRGKVLPPGSVPRYAPKREDYVAGHVPGAVFVDWTRDIVDRDDPVPAQVARPAQFASAMGELGIGDETLVVAYDDYNHMFAGRLAWALRYYGHDAVRVLDGGWTRWVAEGRPTTREIPARLPAPFAARARPELRCTADEVAADIGKDGVLLIDARAPEQYEGKVSAARRAGHIPGARSLHYAKLVDPVTGKFRSPGELVRSFAEAGIDVGRLPSKVVVYCNGGVSCTVPLQALQMLGRGDISLYDGSWNEWGNDDGRPSRSGPEP